MTSRRDLLKVAAGLGLTGTVPTSADRIAAMHLLDQEVSAKVVLDPARFAHEVDGTLGGALDDDWLCSINAAEHAAYSQAREYFKREVAIVGTKEALQAYGDWDAAYFNLAMSCYYAGLGHGAAYENLRRSVIGELTECRECWGVGATKERDVCRSCGGTGTAALRS